VFDLLCLNGYDPRKLPLIERKALLKKIIATRVFFFHGWWRPGDSKPPRCHPDCRRTRWIAAGKILATDPAALVPCPVCGDENLAAEDIAIEGSEKFERIMRCPKCDSRSILLLNKKDQQVPIPSRE
jgi:hypothetical protein